MELVAILSSAKNLDNENSRQYGVVAVCPESPQCPLQYTAVPVVGNETFQTAYRKTKGVKPDSFDPEQPRMYRLNTLMGLYTQYSVSPRRAALKRVREGR